MERYVWEPFVCHFSLRHQRAVDHILGSRGRKLVLVLILGLSSAGPAVSKAFSISSFRGLG